MADDIHIAREQFSPDGASLGQMKTPHSIQKDVWEGGDHRLYRGDACEILSNAVEDASVDLIFADPPYNIGKNFNGWKDKWESDEAYLTWCYRWLDLCIQKLAPNGSMYVMTATQNMPYFDIYLRERLKIISRIVWYYDSSGVQARKYYGSLYEPILFCVKNPNQYTFNAEDIRVEAKTGAKRKLVDYRKRGTSGRCRRSPGRLLGM